MCYYYALLIYKKTRFSVRLCDGRGESIHVKQERFLVLRVSVLFLFAALFDKQMFSHIRKYRERLTAICQPFPFRLLVMILTCHIHCCMCKFCYPVHSFFFLPGKQRHILLGLLHDKTRDTHWMGSVIGHLCFYGHSQKCPDARLCEWDRSWVKRVKKGLIWNAGNKGHQAIVNLC